MAAKKVESPSKSKKTAVGKQDEPKMLSTVRIKQFINEVKVEFGKIVWPDRKHTVGSTGVVVVLVMLIAIYLGAVDLVLGKFVGYILH